MLNTWLEASKYVLPTLGIGFVVLFVLLRAPRFDFVRGLALSGLFLTAVLSAAFYSNDVWNQSRYLNCYEFFHYYLGTKYWPELGYSDLYEAALVAQKESGRTDLPPTVRDLVHERSVPSAQVLKEGEAHKAKFSEARWQEFKGDVAFFRSYFRGTGAWNKMMNDKGYNAPPMWTMVCGALSNHIATSNYWGMQFLASIDLLFMAAAALCVMWAFGPRAAFFLALVLCTQYVASHTHMKAAFMRMDWIMCLIMATCMIKKERWALAGVLMGWATCSRLFPAVFAFGIGAKLLLDLLFERRINRQYLTCLVAFGLSIALFSGISWLETGTVYWKEFITKITDHNDDISAWRVGFKYVWLLSYRGTTLGFNSLNQQYNDWINVYHGIQLAVLLVSVFLVRKLDNYEALCFGIVPAFFLVAPTYYYYIMVLMPALFFAAKVDRIPFAIGVVLVLLEGMGAHYGHRIWDRTFPQFFSISCMMMAITVYLMAASAFVRRPAAPEPAAAT